MTLSNPGRASSRRRLARWGRDISPSSASPSTSNSPVRAVIGATGARNRRSGSPASLRFGRAGRASSVNPSAKFDTMATGLQIQWDRGLGTTRREELLLCSDRSSRREQQSDNIAQCATEKDLATIDRLVTTLAQEDEIIGSRGVAAETAPGSGSVVTVGGSTSTATDVLSARVRALSMEPRSPGRGDSSHLGTSRDAALHPTHAGAL